MGWNAVQATGLTCDSFTVRGRKTTFQKLDEIVKKGAFGRLFVGLSQFLGKSVGLFPLDCARWLARDVECHAVDFRDLVGDSVGDFCNQVIWQARPVRGHGIFT